MVSAKMVSVSLIINVGLKPRIRAGTMGESKMSAILDCEGDGVNDVSTSNDEDDREEGKGESDGGRARKCYEGVDSKEAESTTRGRGGARLGREEEGGRGETEGCGKRGRGMVRGEK